MLRLLPLRVEVEPQLHRVGDLLTCRRVVDVPHDARPGLDQLAAVLAHDLALLADRPLHEQAGAETRGEGKRLLVVLFLPQVRQRVVRDAAARHGRGTHLDGADPAVLGQPGRHGRLPPVVLCERRHGVGCREQDQVRWSTKLVGEVPNIVVGEHRRWRHVRRIPPRRARVDPPNDGVDLRTGQGPIVLEVLDSDRLVDVPGRHLTCLDPVLDRACPGPHLGIGLQRHRRDVARSVASLALRPEDRRDVLAEGRCGVILRERHPRNRKGCSERDHAQRPAPPKSARLFHCSSLPRYQRADTRGCRSHPRRRCPSG